MSNSPRVAICLSPTWPHLEHIFSSLSALLKSRDIAHRLFPTLEQLEAEEEVVSSVEIIAGYGGMRIGDPFLARAKALSGIVSCVSGVDGIDLTSATRRGIAVCNAPTPENFRGMAESAVLLMLHLLHALDETRAAMVTAAARPHPLNASSIAGKTIGVIGWGRISREVAKLLSGWDVRMLVHSRHASPADLPSNLHLVSIQTLMQESDVVCVLAGAAPDAPALITATLLDAMKPSAHFINLSRGSVVDEGALATALAARRIAGAALDVFQEEPLAPSSPLRRCPNVILTPHRVGHTKEAEQSLVPAMQENVMALLEGKIPKYIKNTEVASRWLKKTQATPPITNHSI